MFVVSRYLKPERVMLDMEVGGREEAIRRLAECLRGAAEVKDFDGFVQDVLRREKQGSTAVGMGWRYRTPARIRCRGLLLRLDA